MLSARERKKMLFMHFATDGQTLRHLELLVVATKNHFLFQIPLDMNVDQIMVLEDRGWIVLVNTNNLLLTVILDFN